MTVGELKELVEDSLSHDYENTISALVSLLITLIQIGVFSKEDVVEIMNNFKGHIKEHDGLGELARMEVKGNG